MKICFVAPFLYPYLKGDFPNEHIGGAEYQQQQIINALKQQPENNITVITLDYGQGDEEVINNVRILKANKLSGGIRYLRFFYPMLYLIWKALVKADADVYYLRAASFMLLPVGIYCKLYGKRMVYAAAHDTDFQHGEELVKNARDLWCYRKGLKSADMILTQSDHQSNLLQKSYGLTGIVIRNSLTISSDQQEEIKPSNTQSILWVATIRRFKRAEFYLDIAEKNPEYNFVMIGGSDDVDKDYFVNIEKRAKSIKNLQFKGFIPPNKIDRYFDAADIFINTSIHEGFPNTFLQSWSRGIPVITFFDPDELVMNKRLGIVINGIDDASLAIRQLFTWERSQREEIRQYFLRHHGRRNVERLQNILNQLVSKPELS